MEGGRRRGVKKEETKEIVRSRLEEVKGKGVGGGGVGDKGGLRREGRIWKR